MRDPARAPEPTKDAWATAMDKLMGYSRSADAAPTAQEALDLFFGGADRETAEWEVALLVAFLTYGHRGPGGLRIIDRFLAARGRDLEPAEAAAVVALQRAWASLLEIEAVHAGVGLDLRDLLSGGAVHVREVSGTAQVKKGDVLFAWIVDFPGRSELTGASCMVPRQQLSRVRAVLDDELKRARRRRRGISDRDLVGEIAWAPIAALRAATRDLPMPELHNMHDERLVLCKAHYRSNDDDQVGLRLAAVAELDPTDDGFVWLDPEGHPSLGDGPLVLGVIRVARGDVVLETNSHERLQRGKALIEKTLSGVVVWKADSVQDIEAGMREARGGQGAAREGDLPEALRRELLGKHLVRHYERWVDEPVPALNGKSPRQAVKTRRGRQQVEAMIKDAENVTARLEGGEAMDFDALRRELGLLVDDGAVRADSYDAVAAPRPDSWLAADDQVKARAVETYHRTLKGHPDTPDARLHAVMHVIVENQLAGGDPPEVSAALERLTGEGLTRHEAIHALGSVVAEAMWKIMRRESAGFDRKVVARSLARLSPQGWAGTVSET